MFVNRLEHISIDDDISFEYNNDVMRQCFNGGGAADFGQYAAQNTHDGCEAWFPKERIIASWLRRVIRTNFKRLRVKNKKKDLKTSP